MKLFLSYGIINEDPGWRSLGGGFELSGDSALVRFSRRAMYDWCRGGVPGY